MTLLVALSLIAFIPAVIARARARALELPPVSDSPSSAPPRCGPTSAQRERIRGSDREA